MEQSPNPYSTPTIDPAQAANHNNPLSHMRSADIKKLRNNSHTLRVIAILGIIGWVLVAALTLYFNNSTGYIEIFGTVTSVFIYLGVLAILSAAGIYALLARPSWGKIAGILYCVLLILNLSLLSIALGICGIIALSHNTSRLLFGPKKIPHSLVDQEFKLRKREGRIK